MCIFQQGKPNVPKNGLCVYKSESGEAVKTADEVQRLNGLTKPEIGTTGVSATDGGRYILITLRWLSRLAQHLDRRQWIGIPVSVFD